MIGSLSFAALRARICSRAICRPIASAMRISAASIATGIGATSLSFAATIGRACGASSSCMIVAASGRPIVIVGAIPGGIGDPPVDGGFVPASAMHADAYLRRKSAFGDLAIDRGSRQPGAVEHGSETDDSFIAGHGARFLRQAIAVAPAPEDWERNARRQALENVRLDPEIVLETEATPWRP